SGGNTNGADFIGLWAATLPQGGAVPGDGLAGRRQSLLVDAEIEPRSDFEGVAGAPALSRAWRTGVRTMRDRARRHPRHVAAGLRAIARRPRAAPVAVADCRADA